MKAAFYVIIFVAANILNSQKVVQKSLLASNVSNIHINTDNCFDVAVETWDSEVINIEGTLEGEYNPNLILNITKEEPTVTISAGLHPNFELPSDKLSAHKVISIKLRIKLPNNKFVQLFGTSTDCIITGSFSNLKVSLADGNCTLSAIDSNAEITTQSGHITIRNSKALVTASSKYGGVFGGITSSASRHFKLSTVTGNIHLSKTE